MQLSKEFTKLSETTGTVQNTSDKFTLELSNKNELNSGIFIYPHRQCSFKNTQVYLRCVNGYVVANIATSTLDGGSSDLITVDVANDIWKEDSDTPTVESDDFTAELEKLFNVSNQ